MNSLKRKKKNSVFQEFSWRDLVELYAFERWQGINNAPLSHEREKITSFALFLSLLNQPGKLPSNISKLRSSLQLSSYVNLTTKDVGEITNLIITIILVKATRLISCLTRARYCFKHFSPTNSFSLQWTSEFTGFVTIPIYLRGN